MSHKNVDYLFMVAFLILGITLWVMTSICFNHIDQNCTSRIIRDGYMVIMCIGISLTAIALGFFFCNGLGGKCYEGNESAFTKSAEIFSVLISVLSFVMILISVLILVELHKNESTCNNDTLKFYTGFILGISIVSSILSGISTYYNHVAIPKHLKEEGKEAKKPEGLGGHRYGLQSAYGNLFRRPTPLFDADVVSISDDEED